MFIRSFVFFFFNLVYHIMKQAELKKMLKDLGLSTIGDRGTLANRHKKYTLLYNSECDALNPRPVEELITQLEQEEAETRRLAVLAESTNLTVRVQASEAEIESANRQYLKDHKESYDRLIEDVRSRQDNVKPQQVVVKTQPPEENDEDEILILETPVKIIETISLIDTSDDEDNSRHSSSTFHSVPSGIYLYA